MHMLDAAAKHDVGVRGASELPQSGLRRVVAGRVGGVREFRMPGTPILPTSGGDAVAVRTQIGASVDG